MQSAALFSQVLTEWLHYVSASKLSIGASGVWRCLGDPDDCKVDGQLETHAFLSSDEGKEILAAVQAKANDKITIEFEGS